MKRVKTRLQYIGRMQTFKALLSRPFPPKAERPSRSTRRALAKLVKVLRKKPRGVR